MRWYDCAGAYQAFISLGSTCQTAYQLRRLGLRPFAGPLDWFISRDAADVARLLRNRFRGFMDPNRLQLHGVDPGHYVVRDSYYNVFSHHDFPLIPRWMDAYPVFRDKLNRRIGALFAAAASGPLCFVRIEAERGEALDLYAALASVMPCDFRLLAVNFKDDYQIRHEDWGLPRIASVSVPRGADWTGSDPAWNEIMSGFRLRGARAKGSGGLRGTRGARSVRGLR